MQNSSRVFLEPLPNFTDIKPEQIEPTLTTLLTENKKHFHALLNQSTVTWENLIAPMEEMHDRVAKFWSPIAHLHAVKENDALRKAYNKCIPILSDYNTEMMQNEDLYRAIQTLRQSDTYEHFNIAQKKIIQDELRDLHLAGVDLPPAKKTRFAELQKKLSQLSTQFSENLLDATNAWTLLINDVNELQGLPETAKEIARQNAEQRGQPGWLLTLDYPCYAAVMKYALNRELRFKLYEAYVTRASDQGPFAGQWDNTEVMEQLLKIRHELATLLDFKNFAEYSLATKMAENANRVLNFLNDLVKRAHPVAVREIKELETFAQKTDGLTQLAAWDLAYYSEKLRQADYAISQEDLRPYFPVPKVLAGMFDVIGELFGITIKEKQNFDRWDPHVQFFEIYDSNGIRGCFYTDLYARPHKRDGAWMDDARVRRKLPDGSLQLPIAFLTCNFSRPIDDKPSYLTHEEVVTLFHEFGHCLHHLLTKIDYAAVSGINGVPWDAVEFPSQFMENWCWQKQTLDKISEHEVTHQKLPDSLYQKMLAAKLFQPGLHILRQLEFALFDFKLHLEFDPTQDKQVQKTLDEVREKIAVVPCPSFNRFQHSFSHIFAGGYAAGYYSYEWAEVLSSDAFSKFEENGIFNGTIGRAFAKNILEQGGAQNPMDLFVAFRGREPTIDALLKHHGLN